MSKVISMRTAQCSYRQLLNKIKGFLLPICCALFIVPNTSYAIPGYMFCPSCDTLYPLINTAFTETLVNKINESEATEEKSVTKTWSKGKTAALISFLGLLGGIAAAESYFNEAMKQSTTGATMHKWGDKKTQDSSSKTMKKSFGSKSPFASLVSAYKQGSHTCTKDKSSGKKHCYSNLNAGTVHNHTKFKDKTHEKAAKNYSNYSSGGAIGISKPNKKWQSTPSSVKYNAYYKTQSSVGSHSTNSASKNIGNRQTVKHQGSKKSKLSHQKQSNSTHIQKAANKMSGVPVIGSLYGIHANTQKISPQMHQKTQQMDQWNKGVNGTNTHFANSNHQSFGKQLHHDAKNQSQGEPHKKHPHQ